MFENFKPKEEKDPLKTYAINLNELAIAGKLETVVGRDDEIRRIIRILSRKTKNNPALIGKPGVGKTAVIEGLTQRIVDGNVPDNLLNKIVYQLDLTTLVAGASFQGEFERRLKAVINQIIKLKDKIIIFIDEVHLLIGTGKTQGAMDAANILKPMLARGQMRLIGATTLNEYKKYIEKDSALERRMQRVLVEEPDIESSLTILRGWKTRLELYHGVKIHDNALVSAVNLSNRYINNRFLPDKAIDLIDEACATIKTQINSIPEPLAKINEKIINLEMERASLNEEKDYKSKNNFNIINKTLIKIKEKKLLLQKSWEIEKTKITELKELKKLLDEKKREQENLKNNAEYQKASKILYTIIPELQNKISILQNKIEQDQNPLIKEDVTREDVANVLCQWTGIPVAQLIESDKKRLISLKVNLAKRIKGQNKALEKITNAIFRSRAGIRDASKPIGSFVFMGSTGVGKTETVKALAQQLFNDENQMIRLDMSEYSEKHAIAKLIGSPPGYIGFEEGGQLTEAVRQKPYSIVLFDEIEKANQAVVNILLQILDNGFITDGQGVKINFKNTIIVMTSNIGSGLSLDGKNKEALKLFKSSFSSEFINRIDEIILFNPISDNVAFNIAKKLCQDLSNRVAQEKSIYLKFSEATISQITKLGFDYQYGARPIKRYIEKNIETTIAKRIISNEIVEHNHYIIKIIHNKISIKQRKLN